MTPPHTLSLSSQNRNQRSNMVPSYFQWAARASKIWKRLGGFLPPPRSIPEIDGNCSGGREKRQGCVKELRNRIKPKIPMGYVSKVRRFLIAGEPVVSTSQTSSRAGLQGSSNSRLLGAISLRRQRILKVNLLETARNLKHLVWSTNRHFTIAITAKNSASKIERSL
jgi:hypothetical protein